MISAHPLVEIMRDNLHLRQGPATQEIASAIETTITQARQPTTQSTRKPAPRTPTHTKTIDVPAEKAGLVIGKQGINLRTWQTKNNVTIDRNGDRDIPTLTISGETSDVQATIKTIKALYTSDERRERRRDQSRNTTTCKFFLQGHCKKKATTVTPNTPTDDRAAVTEAEDLRTEKKTGKDKKKTKTRK